MTPRIIKVKPHTPDWFLHMRTRLGGSDAAPVFGIKTPGTEKVGADVCLDKWGESPVITPTPQMLRGTALEPVLRIAYGIKRGVKVGPEYCVLHPDYDWHGCTPDGDILDQNKHVQIKTHNYWVKDGYGEEGTAQVPEYEYIQVAHELAATQHDSADIPVVFAQEETFEALLRWLYQDADLTDLARFVLDKMDFRIYTIDRDRAFEKDLLGGEESFWHDYVLKHTLPRDITKIQNTSFIRQASEAETALIEELKKAYIGHSRAKRTLESVQDLFKTEIIGEDKGIQRDREKITYSKGQDKTEPYIDYDEVRKALQIPDELWHETVNKCAKMKTTVTRRKLSVPWRLWNKEV